ncbi:cation diffusion facilitator family transporter [Parvibaculum sedimenti]|uniref:Cation diffusion facilitator family transporter n=1 Tax=Parvibaculum sedimenti TaxID=2608632 RepID=A0A6N6VFH9_9HYPH|nr:cation diffusion facilitator family transporter [Parvibaculum sedimenti]KAB7738967.1 cation diffusion facilitator family transporter [Parvibaculum sedimenti]
MSAEHHHGQDHREHDHGHGHSHEHGAGNERRVLVALWITGGFMLVEAAGGFISGSLALIADAGHMLTDTGALALAWIAVRLARRPADEARSYGWHRAEILAAFLNGFVMLALSAWIIVEAGLRLMRPIEVLGGPMLVVAIGGLGVNILSFLMLHGAGDSLNLKGAALHVLGDLLGSVAAIIAAIVILLTGFMPVDPMLSVLVALLILRSAWKITRDSAHILMEGTPPGLDPDEIAADLVKNVEGVDNVHHVHAWSLTQGQSLVTLHAHLADGVDGNTALSDIKARLGSEFGIGHATVQLERGECTDSGHDRLH